jgi:flagellar hook assembly protein FlgD
MLLGNTPNPAKLSTRIAFLLPAGTADDAALRMFDAAGRRVRSFAPRFAPGLNEVVWDGTDDAGKPVRAGVYFYRLDVGRLSFTRRMVLVR